MKYHHIIFLLLVGCVFSGLMVSGADADIVIKVRALNPLESQEVAVIHYPLPQEITPDDIIKQNIIFSLPPEEGAEPRKSTFNIEYVVEEGRHFINDEIMMGPREVVTLEAHVRDIWFIPEERFSGIRQKVEEMIAQATVVPPEDPNEMQPDEQEEGKETDVPIEDSAPATDTMQEGPDETTLMLQQEIFAQLDAIATRQAKSTVLLVGVEKHMEAYYENMDALGQIEADVLILQTLLEPEEEEGEEGVKGAEGILDNIETLEPAEISDPDGMLNETDLGGDPEDSTIESEALETESILSE